MCISSSCILCACTLLSIHSSYLSICILHISLHFVAFFFIFFYVVCTFVLCTCTSISRSCDVIASSTSNSSSPTTILLTWLWLRELNDIDNNIDNRKEKTTGRYSPFSLHKDASHIRKKERVRLGEKIPCFF